MDWKKQKRKANGYSKNHKNYTKSDSRPGTNTKGCSVSETTEKNEKGNTEEKGGWY